MTTRFAIFTSHDASFSRPQIVPDTIPQECIATERTVEADPTCAELLRILLESPRGGEAIGETYRRKEVELRQMFASLSATKAAVLHRQLACGDNGDLERAFGRLAEERRERLLNALRVVARGAVVKGVAR